MLVTAELARRVSPAQVTVNALHPGLVNTDFGDVGGIVQFGWTFMRPFGITPEEGARTPAYCASSPEIAGRSGLYFRKCRPVEPNPLAHDRELARRLWEYSVRALKAPDVAS